MWPERKGDGQSPEEYGLKHTDASRGTDRGGHTHVGIGGTEADTLGETGEREKERETQRENPGSILRLRHDC